MIIPILITVIIISAVVSLLLVLRGNRGNKEKKTDNKKELSKKIQKKGKSVILKEAEKKLAHDPHNINALETVGDIYFSEKNWDKAWGIYKTLYDISSAHIEVNVAKCTQKMGIAAFYLDKIDDSVNSLMISVKREPDNFDTNFYLGYALYKKGLFDKAIYCFKKTKLLMPENLKVTELLGLSLFSNQKYRECIPYLNNVLDENPDNKEVLFNIAVSMEECGINDKALKIFVHLRPDPLFGPQACLEAGKMHERAKDFQTAVKDYEIGLKHSAVPEKLSLQIMYRMANTCIALNDIAKALAYLKQIQNIRNGYKDVDALVVRYSELNQNKNLQTYLLSGTSDFVALCRKIIAVYHKDGFVKIEDVQITSDCVEIICIVENPKWEAKQIFRFYRTQNVIGDVFVREFHSKIKDLKCDAGFCITMGSFSDSSHKFVEGRPIDLIEKDQLVKVLKKINMFN